MPGQTGPRSDRSSKSGRSSGRSASRFGASARRRRAIRRRSVDHAGQEAVIAAGPDRELVERVDVALDRLDLAEVRGEDRVDQAGGEGRGIEPAELALVADLRAERRRSRRSGSSWTVMTWFASDDDVELLAGRIGSSRVDRAEGQDDAVGETQDARPAILAGQAAQPFGLEPDRGGGGGEVARRRDVESIQRRRSCRSRSSGRRRGRPRDRRPSRHRGRPRSSTHEGQDPRGHDGDQRHRVFDDAHRAVVGVRLGRRRRRVCRIIDRGSCRWRVAWDPICSWGGTAPPGRPFGVGLRIVEARCQMRVCERTPRITVVAPWMALASRLDAEIRMTGACNQSSTSGQTTGGRSCLRSSRRGRLSAPRDATLARRPIGGIFHHVQANRARPRPRRLARRRHPGLQHPGRLDDRADPAADDRPGLDGAIGCGAVGCGAVDGAQRFLTPTIQRPGSPSGSGAFSCLKLVVTPSPRGHRARRTTPLYPEPATRAPRSAVRWMQCGRRSALSIQ